MANKHNRMIRTIPVDDNGKILEVEIGYNIGGINYFTGNTTPRGYYLRVTPVTISKQNGYETRSFAMFSGIGQLLETATKFSAKKLSEIQAPTDIIDKLINAVCSKNNIILKETVTA